MLHVDYKGVHGTHETVVHNMYKLCKVKNFELRVKGVPHITTFDGRPIRYLDLLIKSDDAVKILGVCNTVMVTGGRNRGLVGITEHLDIVHVKDGAGHEFATRMGNVFTIGHGGKPWVTLLPSKGIKLSIVEEAIQYPQSSYHPHRT